MLDNFIVCFDRCVCVKRKSTKSATEGRVFLIWMMTQPKYTLKRYENLCEYGK